MRASDRMKPFCDKLMDAIDKKQNISCVGLDPRLSYMPRFMKDQCVSKYGESLEAVVACFCEFNKRIINAVKEEVAIVKPQMAFYEAYGAPGIKAFQETVDYAKKAGLLVVEDAKRNDIGDVAEAYSGGHIGEVEFWTGKRGGFDVDAITVSPYLGSDGIDPFLEDCKVYGKGIFVLVKTSNPSSGQLQDVLSIIDHPRLGDIGRQVRQKGRLHLSELDLSPEEARSTLIVPNYVGMAMKVKEWGKVVLGERGYSSVGAVVGATYPKEARILREILPSTYFLVPGYGAQGGTAADVIPCLDADGYGAIVSSSRGVIYAYRMLSKNDRFGGNDFDGVAGEAAIAMKENLTEAMRAAGKYPW